MYRKTAEQGAVQDELERGQFSDGVRFFSVRASSVEAPDSFQVYANGDRKEVVLIISGLNSGSLRATWGANWRTASEAWREWAETQSFMVFYNGQSDSRLVRACNG